MEAMQFTVFGHPQTAGSKRAFARMGRDGKPTATVVDDNPKSRDWKNAVADAARQAYAGELLNGPLALRLDFYRPRPLNHYGTGKKASVLKASAPRWPTGRPDVLKLARAVEDAISGVTYRDDAQIVDERLRKHFGEPARVVITLTPLQEAAPCR